MTVIDPAGFRKLCGRFATGVTIVTTFSDADLPTGMTVSSFTSVSLDPPLVSVAIDHAASAFATLDGADRFTINILAEGQEDLSRRFAAILPDRFEGVGWHRNARGDLLLDGALAHLCCDRHGAVVAGDHTILIGRVIGGEAMEHGRPLLYYRGGYATADGL
jgi:flavin reductase (DIM6/NTAB) family NADH-FMN oxidoreductase RutF